jgi:four helix bundle protein
MRRDSTSRASFRRVGFQESACVAKGSQPSNGYAHQHPAIRGSKDAGLKSQIVRTADSIAANIVEGCGEQTPLEFTRFLRIALNSATELEYHLIVARDRRLLKPETCTELTDRAIEVRRML